MFQAIFLVVACVAIGDTSLGDSQEVNVTQTILQLQASMEELKGSVKELNASREELKASVEHLNTSREEIKASEEELKSNLEKLTAENKEQAIKIKEQDMKIQHLDHKLHRKVDVLRGMGSQSLDLISQITERVSDLEKSDGEVVGFSTYLTVPGNVLLPTSEVIVPFNEITTNIGGHFSSYRHKFRCPVDGYYLFMYSIFSGYIRQQGSDYRDQTNAKLMNDGVEVNRVLCATDTEENIRCHVSNSAVVLCRRNADVYVVTWGSHTKIWARNRITTFTVFVAGSRHNTFSGFLIKSI